MDVGWLPVVWLGLGALLWFSWGLTVGVTVPAAPS